MRHGSRSMLTCTAQKDSGAFCDQPSLPGAPFPICLKHAAKIMAFLNDVAPSTFEDRVIVEVAAVQQERSRRAERQRRAPQVNVVYYVQVGDTIKIGYSSNLPLRLRSYPPTSKLLAYEPGGPALEAQRHIEFADDLTAGREWFKPSARLLAHIASIKANAA